MPDDDNARPDAGPWPLLLISILMLEQCCGLIKPLVPSNAENRKNGYPVVSALANRSQFWSTVD